MTDRAMVTVIEGKVVEVDSGGDLAPVEKLPIDRNPAAINPVHLVETWS